MSNKFNITVCSLFCSIIFISVFAFESKLGNVKIFNFVKLQTADNLFNFNYLADNGSNFNGETIPILSNKIYFLVDGDGSIYWVDLTEEIKNSSSIFMKPAISVNRTSDIGLIFKDNYVKHILEVGKEMFLGKIWISFYPYLTEFDINNICFTRIPDGTGRFKFEVGALNNDLKFFGTTTFEMKNTQNVSINGNGPCRELTVNFTDHELAKNETFCKGYSQCGLTPSQLGVGQGVADIHPKLAISLVGGG